MSIATIGALLSAHPLVAAYIAAGLVSVIAWAIHRPRVQAWLAQYPVAMMVVSAVTTRLLAIAAGLGADVPKVLAALVYGQAPTAPLMGRRVPSVIVAAALRAVAVVAIAVWVVGCQPLEAKAPVLEQDVAKAGVCVLNHVPELVVAEMDGTLATAAAQVGIACGVSSGFVTDLLSAHKTAAKLTEKVRGCDGAK